MNLKKFNIKKRQLRNFPDNYFHVFVHSCKYIRASNKKNIYIYINLYTCNINLNKKQKQYYKYYEQFSTKLILGRSFDDQPK